MFWLFCINFTVTMLWTAISKKRVRLKEAVISQPLPLSVKLPLVSLFGLGHSSTSSFCELNILLISISFLDDWFIAVGSTSCVYPASPRYGFLVLTSNNKSLSFWVYILVYFLMKGKFFSCYFQMKIFLTSVECESGLKFVENFVCVCVFFFWISAQISFLFLLVIDSSYLWILLVKSLLPCSLFSLFCDI